MWIWYKEASDGVTLVRLFGDRPEVAVPDSIDGKPVTELAPYAFSGKDIRTEGCELVEIPDDVMSGSEMRDGGLTGASEADRQSAYEGKEARERQDEYERQLATGAICALAGDFITRVVLPDSLKRIGELCFYQCRELKETDFGGGAIEIGSDAFMNCRKLSTLRIRAKADEPTALRSTLNQRTQATDVWFSDAVVHFPEYQEKYDLIGPAHIFELNIEGEGFRARKCFDGDRFSLSMYDEVFRHAVEKEEEQTLCRMAALRLSRLGVDRDEQATQAQLKEEDRDRYQSYLVDHMETFCDDQVRRRDLAVWTDLYQQGLLTGEHKAVLLKKLTEARWIEGTRQVLGMV